MQRLLDDLDTTHKTKQSPRKPKPALQDDSKENHVDNDLVMLLDGAENWDWAEMEADFMTPKKKTPSSKKVTHVFSIRA